MRVGVVSKSRINVDEHFGRATRFFIYDLENSVLSFVEERQAFALSEGDPKHPFNPERFQEIFAVIEDCKAVLCSQIGDRPGKELRQRGIEPVVYTGTIEDGLIKIKIQNSLY